MNPISLKFLTRLITLIGIVFMSVGTGAQNVNIDSLENILRVKKHTAESKMQLLSKLYYGTIRKDTVKAFSYINEMKYLENTLTDSLSKSILYSCQGSYYNKKDSVAKALGFYEKSINSLATGKSKEIELERAKNLEAKGSIYHKFDDYETAYSLYLEAEHLFLDNESYNELISLYGKMGNIFLRNSNIQRNKQIIEKADAIVDKITDPNALASYYTNRGNVFGNDKDYTNADIFFEKALSILDMTQDQYRLGVLYYNMGYFFRDRGNMEEGETYYRKSLAAFEKDGNKFDICDGITAVGRMLYYSKKYNEAEPYLQKALEMAQQMQSKLLMRNVYLTLSWLEHDRGNYKKAFEYSENGAEYDIELISENTQNQLGFMEVKYETEKKELKIAALKQEKGLILYLGIAAGALFLLTVLLLVYRHRLNRQKVARLEKEKQLVATQSVLDGETAERTRLARDLHDGLGGMLSVVRFNLSDLKNGATIEGNDVERFNYALNTLDESIRELRRVAHNMMPDSLARYGLKASLIDFCNSIPIVRFDYFGSGDRLDTKLEVMF